MITIVDHHRYLAGDGLDTDLPTEWEGNFFTNGPLKLLWLFLNPLFYAFRPMIVRPKTPTHYEFKVFESGEHDLVFIRQIRRS